MGMQFGPIEHIKLNEGEMIQYQNDHQSNNC